MRELYGLILLFGCLRLHSGHVIPCTVSHDARGVLYSVPVFEDTDCRYSWTNRTGQMLANDRGKIEPLVVMKTNRTLLLRECSDLIYYYRDCLSEGVRHTVACYASCTQFDDDVMPNTNNFEHEGWDDFEKQAFSTLSWTMTSVIILTTLLPLLLLLGLVFFLLRDRIWRDPGCFYSAVKVPIQRRMSMDEGITFSSVQKV
uniref:uncharacterized protein n=1 Tax=Semicossyphus pulcher TaxID=241346 RepID=UPI0037E84148